MADRITAYHAYKAAHASLFTAKTPQECAQAAQNVLLNYTLNRLIWAELQHYHSTNTILGLHPIFKVHAFLQELKALHLPEVIKKRNAIYKSIVVAEKQLRLGTEPHLALNRQAIIADKKPLLQAVENYLQSFK